MKMKMNAKNLMVSFFAIASVLLFVATVSAADFSSVGVEVDDIWASNSPAIIAGELTEITIRFTADEDYSDIRVRAEIEGDKVDVEEVSTSFDVEAGNRYKKTLVLRVPYELKDQISDDVELNIKIWGGDSEKYTDSFTLRVQRPSYNVDIKSISVDKEIEAGETFPVDLVLKNIGYNDLDDLYVKMSIPALGIEKESYFGDLIALDCDDDPDCDSCCDDDDDTVSGRLYLTVPYDAEAGIYTIEVEVMNDDMTVNEIEQIVVGNNFPENIVKTASGLFFVNPTNSLKVYKVITPSSENFVTVQADSTKTFDVNPNSEEYVVNVLSMNGQVVGTFTFSEGQEDSSVANPVIVLTVILAIIFLVLLIVLIVLIGKKPEKTEEFGESYY